MEKPESIVTLPPEGLGELLDRSAAYATASLAPGTLRAYDRDWKTFLAWSASKGLQSLPAEPQTVAAYATWMADEGRKPSTITRAMLVIGRAHQLTGHPSPMTPQVRQVLKGIRRTLGTAQHKAAPLLAENVVTASRKLGRGRRDVRARALLLLGFAMGARRSELVALEVSDIEFVSGGLRVLLRRSKTDQEGQGRIVHVPASADPEVCPVQAVRDWLTVSRLTSGRIFRVTPETIRNLVKRAAKLAGLDPTLYSGHSLRSGFVTSAVKAGKRQDKIMAQTGHRSATVMQGYIRAATLDEDNAAEGLLDT